MTRWARVARGTVAAGVSLYVAAFFHSLAGGTLPGVAGISLCVTFSVIVSTALAGRRMPRTRLVASIVASQAMYHWLFGSLGSTTIATAGALGHVHHAHVDFGSLSTHVHTQSDMLFAHIAAAIVTFVVLAFGERSATAALYAAGSFVISLLPHFAHAPLPWAPFRLFASTAQLTVTQLRRVDHSGLRHRGPPVPRIA